MSDLRSPVPELLKRARTALRRECGSWLNDPSISGFGVGVKETQGVTTDEPALQVFVHRKQSSRKLSEKMIPAVIRLPHSGENVVLDVVECHTGLTLAHALAGDGIRQRHRSIYPGSVGCFVRPDTQAASSFTYGVSCWHVAAAGQQSNTFVDWCEDPEGELPNMPFGRLDRYLSPNRTDRSRRVRDAALVRINPGTDVANFTRGGYPIQGVRTTPLRQGELLKSYGFGSKQQRTGLVTNPLATVTIAYKAFGELQVSGVIKTSRMSQPGDSGSIAIDSDNLAVGMIIGGDTNSSYGWTALVPIPQLLEHFNVRLVMAQQLSGQAQAAHADDVAIVARTIWGEAEGEPLLGKVAVANVISNRASAGNPRRFGASFADVCLKNNRSVWQFSCWTQGSARRRRLEAVTTQSDSYRVCLDIASKAVSGQLDDITEGSTHYHTRSVFPSWSRGKQAVFSVGDHLFFNNIA
ncbi:MAG: cell wall hydrolase [Pseudomonadales bacterium]|nr:cell wall hydrolase [Pseudomonadales bacterium]